MSLGYNGFIDRRLNLCLIKRKMVILYGHGGGGESKCIGWDENQSLRADLS